MKCIAFVLVSLVLAITAITAAPFAVSGADSSAANRSSAPRQRIFMISCDRGRGIDSLHEGKAQAAMNLVAEFSGKYELISPDEIDSAVVRLIAKGERANAISVARALHADLCVQFKVSRLANILRADMILFRGDSLEKRIYSKGYDFIRYKSVKDDASLLDPALLRSFQRAFASAIGDSTLFDSIPEKFAAKPARTVVIAGFEFKDNPEFNPRWELFTDKIRSSFYMTDKIFEYGHNAKKYVLYDLESRDTIFALNNMHFVENYKSVSMAEMKLFERFEVDYVVSGDVVRTEEGAQITLYLLVLRAGSVFLEKTATASLKEDSLDEVNKVIQKLTIELLSY